jgi:hypothetical protein
MSSPVFSGAVGGGATVRRTPAEHIVEFLSFSNDRCASLGDLNRFTGREWKRALRWLDDSGLPFYFLQKLKDTNATPSVPPWVISHLERNFAANQGRFGYMSNQFAFLNQKFNDASVRFAVLKGISLVPQFCPDAALRHQSDFDYLIDDQSLQAAQKVLVEVGYSPKLSSSSQEFIFLMPGQGEPSRSDEQYEARAPHAVELHLDVWDSDLLGLPLIPRLFSAERTETHEWNGLAFPALAEEDAFLLQVLHACNHLFTYWIRMSCLFEIGYFLNRRVSDTSFWKRIEQRVGDDLVLKELVVVVTELVAKVFAPPLPSLVRTWGSGIRPASRVWIDSYARYWAFCELPVHEFRLFPRAKLAMFLQQQYMDARVQKRLVRNRILTFARLSRIASSIKNQPSRVLDADWRKRQLLIRRTLFHALSGLRYVCEIPRWLWLNRAGRASARVLGSK